MLTAASAGRAGDWIPPSQYISIISLDIINRFVAFYCAGCDAAEVRGRLPVRSPGQPGKPRATLQTRFTPQLDEQ